MRNCCIKLFVTLLLLAPALSVRLCGQSLSADSLTQLVYRYRAQSTPEKVFLQTDKNQYFSNEIIWCSLYTLDAYSNSLSKLSKIAYVELLNAANKPILQAKLELKNGTGTGSFYIPASTVSGNYRLRAYTNWMKNDGPSAFFESVVTIINPANITPSAANKPPLQLHYFPEGGTIVYGVPSRLGITVSTADGAGQAASIFLMDEKDTVAHANTGNAGVAQLRFVPTVGHKYQLLGISKDTSLSISLNDIANSGYTCRLDRVDNNLLITVQASADIGNSALGVYLLSGAHGLNIRSWQAPFKENIASFTIPITSLSSGINSFTVFDLNGRAQCERLYFNMPANAAQSSASIVSNKKIYSTREKISLDALLESDSSSRATVRVVKVDNTIANSLPAMPLNWLISSEAVPAVTVTDASDSILDNIMLTCSNNRFSLLHVNLYNTRSFEFPPEYNGHLVFGRVVDNKTGNGVPNISAFLSVAGRHSIFLPTTSKAGGNISFELNDFYAAQELIVQTSLEDSNYHVELQSPFSTNYNSRPLPPLNLTAAEVADLQQTYAAVQIQRAYHYARQQEMERIIPDTSTFYYKADEIYALDNYTRFTTMEEVLREYVTGVNVTKRKGRYHFQVYDAQNRRMFEDDPLVLVDGVPVFDFNRFINYDPLKIQRVEVVSHRYLLGTQVFSGIINCITYTGDFAGFELDPHASVIEYEALQPVRKFFSPQYNVDEQTKSRLPDYRTVLYWGVQGDSHINLFSSDVPGKYRAIITSINEAGNPVTSSCEFDVVSEQSTSSNNTGK